MNDLTKLAMLLLGIFLIGILNSGCSKDGNGSATSSHKALWSQWSRDDGNLDIDLTNAEFGTPVSFYVYFKDDAQCLFDLTIAGTESQGTYSIGNGFYISGGTDPGCFGMSEVGTFELVGSVLNICTDGTDCGVYK